MQSSDPYPPPAESPRPSRLRLQSFPQAGSFGLSGERLGGLAGLVLMLSALMGWYVGAGEGIRIAVIGWHTGTLGKLVFFLGLALLLIVLLREAGIELPASVPESLVVIAIGALATIFVLIQLISIPDRFLPATGRGAGIWVALVAAIAVVVAGLFQASEEL